MLNPDPSLESFRISLSGVRQGLFARIDATCIGNILASEAEQTDLVRRRLVESVDSSNDGSGFKKPSPTK